MNNNVALALLIIVGAAAASLLVFGGNEPASDTKTPAGTPREESSGTAYEAKVDAQGAVTITITPLELSAASPEWKFDVVMETHSVELDQDMTKVVMLVDDNGKEYKPLRWEGAPPGGHHREGVLVFAAVQPVPRSVGIVVKNVGEVSERSFKWNTDESI